ncbi:MULTISPECIES: tRNA glutamyl-Q(34) synthetase GluQRS [unclassified Shewanella]|uniref:tRNA glutamyl-Q(34) synthetase GluQRS n=1 Tax=unclassified Shewanella TaxID=196818 RepID=UPI001BBEC622|nr:MULTISPECIES: tRNA glutamyl-Q(34) synthetase GluQRS [unclassified Shewanella]GIU06872.1 glutamyl-Q tRNA(Asp) synthetase [Shewanella sp. MBTL60-112-B1]GIU26237.1 glutamyl-Q tRNA(Asp) synthetase [Shewanella sp. MBTL60-112-B2]
MANTTPYIGRFAPSPSGPLHFGSLIAALGSFLRARSLGGKWLLRIEDIDPPREIAGASSAILKTLEAYGLEWDDSVLYQSQRLDVYQARIEQLLQDNQAYYCQCTRKQIQAMGGSYDGRCGQLLQPLSQGAIRVRNPFAVEHFVDQHMGRVSVDSAFAAEDFIIKRSDGLYAYQLAVVLDDIYQQITEVVRGCDLLEPTCRQESLYQILKAPAPKWLHLPLACAEKGRKLSKQNHAAAIDNQYPQASINAALGFLGQQPVTAESQVSKMIEQAVSQFDLSKVPKQSEILLDT